MDIKDLSSIIDLVIVGIVAISVIIAFVRGFITEVLSLFVWIGAFIGAAIYFEDVAQLLPNLFGSSDAPNLAAAVNPENINEVIIASGISFVITFLGLLFALGLVNLVISIVIRRLKITWPDRFLGAFFGFLRGGFIVAILALFVSHSPFADSKEWKEAKFSAVALVWANQLEKMVPENFIEQINTNKIIDEIKFDATNGFMPNSGTKADKESIDVDIKEDGTNIDVRPIQLESAE